MSNSTDKTKDASSGEGSNTALCYVTEFSNNAEDWDVGDVFLGKGDATKSAISIAEMDGLHWRLNTRSLFK